MIARMRSYWSTICNPYIKEASENSQVDSFYSEGPGHQDILSGGQTIITLLDKRDK